MKKILHVINNLTKVILKQFKIHSVTSSLRHFVTLTIFCFLFLLPAYSYEDYIIATNGRLTDIKIQNNDIIDVYPLITVMNDKNTLFIHPLKSGKTKFTVLKNNKDKYLFNVNVGENSTEIDEVNGFEVLAIDCPPNAYEYYFDLDEPPVESSYSEFIKNLDEPPVLRGE